jgi:hypothetical protein
MNVSTQHALLRQLSQQSSLFIAAWLAVTAPVFGQYLDNQTDYSNQDPFSSPFGTIICIY